MKVGDQPVSSGLRPRVLAALLGPSGQPPQLYTSQGTVLLPSAPPSPLLHLPFRTLLS